MGYVMAGIGVWMGGDNEEVCGAAGGDVVASHFNASFFIQVYIAFSVKLTLRYTVNIHYGI